VTVAVELRGLRLRYPGGSFQLAVDELRVAAGERVAVVGPSGSGKTTLLHLLAGLLLPDAGQVRVGGADLVQWSDRERRRWRATQVGLSFQDLSLIPYLDGLANLLLPLRLQRRGGPDASAVARARDLARTFGVGRPSSPAASNSAWPWRGR
jgi:putative ABC transport system ATP-binding protein